MKKIRIVTNGLGMNTHVFLDDVELDRVACVKVVAKAGDVVSVHIELRPEEIEIEGQIHDAIVGEGTARERRALVIR